MGRLLERAYSTFAEEARAPRDRVHARDGRRPGDRLGRRPRAADHLEPALERVPLDARRRADRARAREPTNGTVAVDVADSGPGIARRRSASGSSARSGRRDGHGTGLGLPIARELAVALGGRIELDSEVGRGSRFRLFCRSRGRSRRFRGASRPARPRWRRSTRASRSSTPFQPDDTRSTSRARSSTRACRSASRSPSSRSSRRIAWLSRPRISAMWRATGSTSARRPSWTAAPIFSGSAPRALRPPRRAPRSACASARSPPRGRRARPARRPRPRSVPWPARVLSRPRAGGYAPRRMDSSELDYELPPS